MLGERSSKLFLARAFFFFFFFCGELLETGKGWFGDFGEGHPS